MRPGYTRVYRNIYVSKIIACRNSPASSPELRREGAPTLQLAHGHRSAGRQMVEPLDNILAWYGKMRVQMGRRGSAFQTHVVHGTYIPELTLV